MKQPWRRLEYAVSLVQASAVTRTAGSVYGDILSQVTLPMILALAIILFSMSSQYLIAIETLKSIGDKIPRDQQDVLLDLQRQKLIIALQQIRWEEEKRLLLPYYVADPARLKLDHDFKAVCEQAYHILSHPHARAEQARTLYQRVLSASQLREAAAESLSRTAPDTFISTDNIEYVRSQIEGFLGEVESHMQAFQLHIITRGFADMLTNSARHRSAKVQELAQKIRQAPAGSEEHTLAQTALHKHFTRELQEQLARDGYRFLPQTWQELKL